MEDLYKFDEEFRDSIGTVDESGKRIWVYPKKPKGKLHTARIFVAIFLLALLFSGPFIKIGGQPLLMMNLFERKFVILGAAFWPQDFYLFALTTLAFMVFIVLFSAVFGRVWCGWACPQTIFMEMVFRKIEYWIEGDANQQRKLNQSPWTSQKILKKSLKKTIFLLISILIAHTLMAYLIGIDEVKEIVSSPPAENPAGFTGMVAFTGIFYGLFAYFREQACIAVCPYGRLQGVFLGKESIVVAYDWIRGEPRGKLKKGAIEDGKGDCIDCKLCVHACPTNIDIRNGTQLECVNCTACIDACDDVMTKIKKPKGLIRYDSFNGIQNGQKLRFTARIAGYSVVLLLLLTSLGFLLATRADIDVTVLRIPGQLYQEQENNRISNLYNIQFVNKTFDEVHLSLLIKDIDEATIKRVGEEEMVIPPNDQVKGVYFIELPRGTLEGIKTPITIQLFNKDELIDEFNTNFLGPSTL